METDNSYELCVSPSHNTFLTAQFTCYPLSLCKQPCHALRVWLSDQLSSDLQPRSMSLQPQHPQQGAYRLSDCILCAYCIERIQFHS